MTLQAAQILIDTGILIVRDPRVKSEDNDIFLDTIEDYFNQEYDTKMKDARPDLGYQVGVTPGTCHFPCSFFSGCLVFIVFPSSGLHSFFFLSSPLLPSPLFFLLS